MTIMPNEFPLFAADRNKSMQVMIDISATHKNSTDNVSAPFLMSGFRGSQRHYYTHLNI